MVFFSAELSRPEAPKGDFIGITVSKPHGAGDNSSVGG
jgi:hypothetical protein